MRRELANRTITRRQATGEFVYFQTRQSVVLFNFTTENSPNGIAARVLWFPTSVSRTSLTNPTREFGTTQAKRSSENDEDFIGQATTVDDLYELIKAGYGTEYIVPANDSVVNWSDLTGQTMHMPGMNERFRWDVDDDSEDEDLDAGDGDESDVNEVRFTEGSASTKPHLEPRSIPEDTITPLLKRANSEDLQNARAIVKNAISQSSKLNKARLAMPARNTYGLNPGTVLASGRVRTGNDTTNQDIPPLLKITDQIAEAAALVAEADAVAMTVNMTKRAVAVSGTYWMESLSRKGTVPWGNDPSYVVFRNVLDYGAVGDGVTVSS